VTVTSGQGQQQQKPQPQTNVTAAQFMSQEALNTDITDIEGKTFRLSDYKDKVVVLDLWATWCGPCRLEIPHLIDLSKEYESRGVEVIGLTTEEREQAEQAVHNFVSEFKINYRIGWGREIAPYIMRSNSIPQTFVIGRGGQILLYQRGYSPALAEMIRTAIERADKTGD
jgi:thiol-disulfide isomerase/thioredoxin